MTAAGETVAFALGSNLGDRLALLRLAVDFLAGPPGITPVAVSSVYETEPVGGPAQPAYLNAVLVARTTLPPPALLALAQRAERAAAREREVRWGPRTLDVDVLAVGQRRQEDPTLTLPHPRAHERAFVLVPWAEVDPEFVIAGRGRVATLAGRVDVGGVSRRDDLGLRLPGVEDR